MPLYFPQTPPSSIKVGTRDEVGTAWTSLYRPLSTVSPDCLPPKLPTAKGIRNDGVLIGGDHIQGHVCLGALQPGAVGSVVFS